MHLVKKEPQSSVYLSRRRFLVGRKATFAPHPKRACLRELWQRSHQRINEREELIRERTGDAKVEDPQLRKGNKRNSARAGSRHPLFEG
ncbi:hypothetical protein TNCV_2576111 [Trichonephila clavipes]|uniref:Uncharacterized protein n=1 Tax=Trichonephila clavipes TaxID=2585209 RepID=A0A8X6V0R3_TRICX|nr:hypothetical protein TNCV_2576111 [Trichonephila clavipes]